MRAEMTNKRVIVRFDGRRMGMGALTRYRIYSLSEMREIHPQRTERSRTGRHWTDIWYLPADEYIVVKRDISNSGKHYCELLRLVVRGDKYEIKAWVGEVPEFVRDELCVCIRERMGLV